jgi:hypothetical protein
VTIAGAMLAGSAAVAANVAATDPAVSRSWNFEVFLNDKPIGHHRFLLRPEADGYTLQTEAEFEVSFLFFTAYRYRHENVEQWRGGCLESIEARTNDNGQALEVAGSRGTQGFSLISASAEGLIDAECVRTFAYWDRAALQDTRLLNSQTGEYQTVELRPMGREIIEIGGQAITAQRYALSGDGLALELWYSPEGDWLKLTSNVGKGRQLRYELVQS